MSARSILPAVWEVPQEFRGRMGEKAGRQRAMLADGHLLLVLHRPPKADEDQREGRYFWRQPDGTWSSSALGGGPGAVNKQLAEYADVLEKLDRQEEAATSADEYFAVLSELTPLHRAARHVHQVLQDARKMCPQDRDLINLRDRAYDIERMADLLYDAAKHGLDFTVAKRAEEEARLARQMAVAAHRLNLLAAFFFPIATLTALFGANLKHGLEVSYSPLPFFGVLVVSVVCGGVLTIFVSRHVGGSTAPSQADPARLRPRRSP